MLWGRIARLNASFSLARGRFGVAPADRRVLRCTGGHTVGGPTIPGQARTSEMRMLCRMQRIGVEMFGASGRSLSSAAYSQTLPGLAEGSSNNNATPDGYPRPHVLI